jgi:TetR/AcrR family fatty acid metabolism transcriptional regulator
VPVEHDRKLQRRQRILDASIAVFSRKGYRDAAVDDIAAESATSKGGVYFHFPSKQAIFLTLVEEMGGLLLRKVEAALAAETEPLARGDAALLTVLRTFAEHRALARLFLIEAAGASREFHGALIALHERFATLIKRHLDDAMAEGAIPPINTTITSVAWFGAVNEVAVRWLLTNQPERLEDVYPTLRVLLARSAGLPLPKGDI